MGGNNSKRGSYDLEKSERKATSKKLKTEKAISFINLTEQEIYEDLFPFRRRSTKRRRNLHDDDPRPYSVAVMQDNCYDDTVLPQKRTSLGSDSGNMKMLERRDIKSEPILYNENLPEDVPQVPPRGITVNQNEGYVYSVEDFPQQFQYSLHTRFMDTPNEPIHTFMSDSTSAEDRQYHSIQENSKRTLNKAIFQPRRASCPDILLETLENSYFPNITEYYFQTVSQRQSLENHNEEREVSGSSSISSGMSEVGRGLAKNHFPTNTKQEQNFIHNGSDDNSLTKFDVVLKENELDPCRIYDTIKTSDVLQPYEIQLINEWLSKAQANCYINRESRKKSSSNLISSLSHNEEDFFTAASDSLPSYTGSRSNKVTFDEMVTKRVYAESSGSDEGDGTKRNPVPRRNSDTSSLTSSDAESVKFSLGYRYRDEKGAIYSEDGYRSSEENSEDSEEDKIKMRDQQLKLLMSNPIISAESIEQLRSNYHATMSEQKDLHVISETEEEEDEENFYDALDQERNKELIEFIEQYPSLNGSSDGNCLDRFNGDSKENDYLDPVVQSSFAEFETLCQTEKLCFDVQCEWDDSNLKEEMQPIFNENDDNNLLELGRKDEHNPKISRRNEEKQNEGFESDESNQNNGTHLAKRTKIVEELEPVYHIPYETKSLEHFVPNDNIDTHLGNGSSWNFVEKDNVNFDPIIKKETEGEPYSNDLQPQGEEDLYRNYEYINRLMNKAKQTEELTSANDLKDNNSEEENDKLLGTGYTIDEADSGQILYCKQEETYEPKVFKNDNVVYPVPDQTHQLEEIVPYNSENFDFEQSIKYEFIHSQQLIYPVKIKDDHVDDKTSNTKYRVTSYDPNMTDVDDMKILKPFDEKSIGLLPNEADLQLRTSEGFSSLDDNSERLGANDEQNLQYLEDKPLRTNTTNDEQDVNVFKPELQEGNKFSHRKFTNPFLNDQINIEHQMEKKSIDEVQQSSVIAPVPKPRKNPPKSNNFDRVNNDGLQGVKKSSQNNFNNMESQSAHSQNTSNPEIYHWVLAKPNLNDNGDDGAELSYILNKGYIRNQPPQTQSGDNIWINSQSTNLDEVQSYYNDEDVLSTSGNTSRIPDDKGNLIEMDILSKEEPTRSSLQSDFSMISFGDLDMDRKSKGDSLIDGEGDSVTNVFQETQTDKGMLLDETTFVRKQNKNHEQKEDLSTIQDIKQKEIEYRHTLPNNYPAKATQVSLNYDTLRKGTYDGDDTKQGKSGNQSSIKEEASDDEMYYNKGLNFNEALKIQPDNSLIDLDGTECLKNEVISDTFDKNEYLHIDSNEESNIDNANVQPITFEWFPDKSNEYLRKPLQAYCEIQKLPVIRNVNTSVIYYEQFQCPTVTEKKDEEKEEEVSYQGNISFKKEYAEIMSNKNNEVDLRNSLVLQEHTDLENIQSNVYPVHTLEDQDQDASRLNPHFIQIPTEHFSKGNSESQQETTVNKLDAPADIFPVCIKLDSSKTSEEENVLDEVAEQSEESIKETFQDYSDNFNELNELSPNKESIFNTVSHISIPKRDLVTKSFQDNVLDKTFVDYSKTHHQEMSENLITESRNYDKISTEDFKETKPIQNQESTDVDIDIDNSSLTKFATTEADEMQQKILDCPSILRISDTEKTQKRFNRLNPVETDESRTSKRDTPDNITENKDRVTPRRTLSQIFRNRQQHVRPKSAMETVRNEELNSSSRRTKSNPEEKSETSKNPNNQTSDTYLRGLFSKISNTKALNTFEKSSANITPVNRKYMSKPEGTISRLDNDDYNFINSKTEQTVLEDYPENVSHEAVDNPLHGTSIERKTYTLDNFRENSIVKEESDEELELEKIFQDLDFISERIKSVNETDNNVNVDDLYIELLRMRVAVHKIQRKNFNYNLMSMQREALQIIRSLLKDIEYAKRR
ncbi:putative uncharacterized protein DDB_G0282133 [Agrilus planipennis]|uniref:Uncharacterized protein n=1 Tax=Agrilus planipennis TaxID=224129 RepID=A0A1W4WNM3_AGRPL|nr:putative uncharacterized protein DDB_G0282133 [Agrilus planipennis]